MSYSHTLVAAVATPESQQLLDEAVSIAHPVNARISLIILASDPELYNRLATPMLEDLCEVMQEETQDSIDKLSKKAKYPIEHTFITYGTLNERILDICRKHVVDLVIYDNHNHNLFSRATCSVRSVIHTSQMDVLLVPLAGD